LQFTQLTTAHSVPEQNAYEDVWTGRKK